MTPTPMSPAAKVQIYTTPTCPYCIAAKRLLKQRGVPFDEHDVSAPAERARVRAELGWPTVPVVVAEGRIVGGYTELAALDEGRGLDHLR